MREISRYVHANDSGIFQKKPHQIKLFGQFTVSHDLVN